MYQIQYDRPVSVHFIGIGGISMSGLAEILLDRGFSVSGSDRGESSLTEELRRKGASIHIGHDASNIPEDCSCVVYTAAIHPDNPEYRAALERGIPMLTRAQLLGEIMQNYTSGIAVAGTHGKTTTTSMLALMALESGLDPTVSVGGMLPSIGGNLRIGSRGTFITEACEYTNSFLSLFPTLGIILNIEEDHLDFFKDLDDIRRSFRRFAEQIAPEGTLVINGTIPALTEITGALPCRVVTFGGEGSDYRAAGIRTENGVTSFDAVTPSGIRRLSLRVPGDHNILNALAAIAAADCMGISHEAAGRALSAFTGADRRFEHKGNLGSVTVIDDYAHHPTEIRATLKAARTVAPGEIWCVFQPHTYTRTKALLPDFADALTLADHVIVAEIYAARETDTLGMSAEVLRGEVAARGTDAYAFSTFAQIEDFIRGHVSGDALLITMGAGDVHKVGEDLLSQGRTA